MSLLQRTEHSTYCPLQGRLFVLQHPERRHKSVNAVWTYEAAYPAVAEINDYLCLLSRPGRQDRDAGAG